MSYEDDLCSSGFESLQQWWVSEFEEGNEERDEGEGSDGAHSPFKSSQDERFHSVYCLGIKDEAFIPLFQKKNRVSSGFAIWVLPTCSIIPENRRDCALFASFWQREKHKRRQEASRPMALVAVNNEQQFSKQGKQGKNERSVLVSVKRHYRHSLKGEEAIEVIDGKVRQVWIDVTATTALQMRERIRGKKPI